MKLLYLYIENYGCIKDQEFNFDSNYHFHLEKEDSKVWRIIEDKVEHPLPSDFWASSSGKHNVVESVSAIVGENGSGKTTLARFIGQKIGTENEKQLEKEDSALQEITWQHNESKKYVSIFLADDNDNNTESENDYSIISNTIISFRNNEYPPITKSPISFFLRQPKLVYYSPHYTTEHLIDPTTIIDLSTTRCLAQGADTRIEHYQNLTNSTVISLNHAHEHYEYMNCLRLIQSHKETNVIKGIPFPKKVIIYPEKELIKIVKNELIKLRGNVSIGEKETNKNLKLQSCYSDVIQMIDAIHSNDCFIVSFVYYIACYCRDHLHSAANVSQSVNDNPIKDELIKIKKYTAFARELCKSLPPFQTIDNLKKQHESILTFLNSNKEDKCLFSHEYSFFSMLDTLYNNVESNETKTPLTSINCPCSSASEIIDLYYKCFSITNFLSVTFLPHLSSGEMSYITMFSRIYEAINNELASQNDFILFLDEAETTLHPEWQQLLVSNIIDFLEEFASGHKVHVIFASHSPILLSDIPDSNVVFLKKTIDGHAKVVEHKETGRTFASNIYTLYKKSFFMTEGLMGKFAEQKIDDIIKELIQLELNVQIGDVTEKCENLQRQICFIGEPVIRKQLEDRLNWIQRLPYRTNTTFRREEQ